MRRGPGAPSAGLRARPPLAAPPRDRAPIGRGSDWGRARLALGARASSSPPTTPRERLAVSGSLAAGLRGRAHRESLQPRRPGRPRPVRDDAGLGPGGVAQ